VPRQSCHRLLERLSPKSLLAMMQAYAHPDLYDPYQAQRQALKGMLSQQAQDRELRSRRGQSFRAALFRLFLVIIEDLNHSILNLDDAVPLAQLARKIALVYT